MLIFRMWYGACLCSFWSLRQPIHQKQTVMYEYQYFPINTSTFKCNDECETQNAEPEIGTDRSSQTWQNLLVDRYRSRFGQPTFNKSGFWTGLEPNRPGFAVQNLIASRLPGPVATTTHTQSSINQLKTTFSYTSRRGPWEACYELPVCEWARRAAYSRFAPVPVPLCTTAHLLLPNHSPCFVVSFESSTMMLHTTNYSLFNTITPYCLMVQHIRPHHYQTVQCHRQQGKSTISCATGTHAQLQLIASLQWTPVKHAVYSHL
jgi:hypothetical protein